MKKSAAVLLATLLSLGTSVAVQAQGSEWERLNAEATSFYKQGRYDQAVVAEKKALQVAEQNLGPDHNDVATSLNNLAWLYMAQGQYAQAEPLYTRSLAIMEKALGPDHPSVATVLCNLATLYRKTGREIEAKALEDRAWVIVAMKR